MKRQEMINLISDNVLFNFLPNFPLYKRNLIADMMLSEAEKNGMIAPGYGTELPNGDHSHKMEWEENE